MIDHNNKYIEDGRSDSEYGGGSYELTQLFSPPPQTQARAQRRAIVSRRTAKPGRRQLVILLCDDSKSMSFDGKCEALTNACQEMVYQMDMQSPGQPKFDVAILPFGDFVFVDERTMCVPVSDINPDDICFKGTSGGTKIKRALTFVEQVLQQYENAYLRHHADLQGHPVPLIVTLSDGYNGDGDPRPIADRIKAMPLSIGLPPLHITVGIEFGRDEPDVKLLQNIATYCQERERPLYFDISELHLLTSFLASVVSSGSSTPGEVFQTALTINPSWG